VEAAARVELLREVEHHPAAYLAILALGEAAAFMVALVTRKLRRPVWYGCDIELLLEPWIALVLELEHTG
jgi:hypothetical protein